MLYRPEAFEPLTKERWSERRVREAIGRIVADSDDAFRGRRRLWRADSILARIRANVHNEGDDVMWGTPGTLLAAQAMLGSTREQRWRDAWEESADALLARRRDDGLWVHHLYRQTYPGLGPPHGVVG